MRKIYFTLLIFLSLSVYSQSFEIIADINQGTLSSRLSEDNVVIQLSDLLLFAANDGVHGYELWSYDGSETKLVKDIYEGASSSECQNFHLLEDKVIFTADDGIHGIELWITDGTEQGTKLIKDINEGNAKGVFEGSGNVFDYFHVYNGALYFNGNEGEHGYELWRTDGTEEGTYMVKNILVASIGSFPHNYIMYKEELFFVTHDGLWKTDGTEEGTIAVKQKQPNGSSFNLSNLKSMGDYMLMMANDGLWRSDGTDEGTYMIKELSGVTTNWSGNKFTRLGNIALFPARDSEHGPELWRTDGTTDGTYMVVDLLSGTDGYAPQNTILFEGKMYYKGELESTGIEFFRTDGTAEGTKLVKDIRPGSIGSFSLPTIIMADSERMYLTASSSFYQQLWISDGTEDGTYMVNINGSHSPRSLYKYNDKLFFFACTDSFGCEPCLLSFDPTSIKDNLSIKVKIYPNPTSKIISIESENIHILKAKLLNFEGRFIQKEYNNNQIDVSDLPSGVYFLELQVGESNQKIVKRVVITE